MKKILLLILLLLAPITILAALLGDVDGNGKVGASDYLLIRKHILGISTLTGDSLVNADVNSDGKVNSQDYILIRKAIINGVPLEPIATNPPITREITPTIEPSPVIDTKTNYIEVYFLNTINNSAYKEAYSTNDAFIVKTSNGKYILIDTGIKSSEILNTIYNKLKELQKKSTVTIDYMIISHMHSDHYGNAVDIINNKKMKINNLILKGEKASKIDEEITEAAKNKSINTIETNSSFYEGLSYEIDTGVKLYFFNVKDVYENEICTQGDYRILTFSSKYGSKYPLALDKNGKYFYIKKSDYVKNGENASVLTTSDLTSIKNDTSKSKYYAYVKTRTNNCNNNSNSIALVFQVATTSGNKYVYIPSDLENNGYPVWGEYDNNYKVTIHGSGVYYYYEYNMVKNNPAYIINNKKLSPSTSIDNIKVPSEYLIAKSISEKFSDIKENLVIYQQSHHGINSSKAAVDALNLNRSSVYSIVAHGGDPKVQTNIYFYQSQTNLNKTNVLYVGMKNGIKCTIKGSGKTSCSAYS